MTAIGKRIEALELQARAAKWAVYQAWVRLLPTPDTPPPPRANIENALSIDAALCSRFPELARPRSRDDVERSAEYEAQLAALDAGMAQAEYERQFDPPTALTRADKLEAQHSATVAAGILLSETLTADERVFLLASKAQHEWRGNLECQPD